MTDSKFVFKIRPLSYFVQTIFAGWEYQKAALVDNVKVGGDVTSDASAGTSITREDLNQEQDSREVNIFYSKLLIFISAFIFYLCLVVCVEAACYQ